MRSAANAEDPSAKWDAVCLTLVQVSRMITNLPQIAELEINPLLVDEAGVLAGGRAGAHCIPAGRGPEAFCDPALPKGTRRNYFLGRQTSPGTPY